MRKWIIIEDDHQKAEGLIQQIATAFSQDKITWIYAKARKRPRPYRVEIDYSKINRATYKSKDDDKIIIEKNIVFHWPKNEQDFIRYFNKENGRHGILLLDIQLSAVGNAAEVTDTLREKVQDFLGYSTQEKTETLVGIISNATLHGRAKRRLLTDKKGNKIAENDRRIITDGGSNLTYEGDYLDNDCKEIISICDNYWNKFYGGDHISIQDFLAKMSLLSIEDCHNIQDQLPGKKEEYIAKGIWSDWDMPLQLQYLIQLIGWPSEKFISTFKMKDENGSFQKHPICECLKTFGNKDSDSFSLLAAAFLAWAAHRELFPDGERDEDFVNEILKVIDTDNENIARSYLLTPPQQNETLQKTIIALYHVFKAIFISTRTADQGEDILKKVTLDKIGLSLDVDFSPSSLMKYVSNLYREKHLDPHSSVNTAHDTSGVILNYLCLSNYSDKYIGNPDFPLLGSDFGLKIIAKNKDTTTIRLGYGKFRHHLH